MLRTFPKRPCHFCGLTGHWPFQCLHKARKPLATESKITKAKRQKTGSIWFERNPPDENGYWYCYLNISSLCPKTLTRSTITLEHVKAKVRRPDLKYDVNNLLPACSFCNKLKGSRSLEELVKIWPHLVKYLDKRVY